MALRFKDQHVEMLSLADDILTAARSAASERCSVLLNLRLKFARAVDKHCREEGMEVKAAAAKGKLDATLVSDMNVIVHRWRSDLALCNSQWPPRRIFENPKGFQADFSPLVYALRQHVRREERELLPALT